MPWETPLSAIAGHPLPGMRLGVATELALAGALDKGDLDPLFVNPLPEQEYVLAALDRMGFRFKGADLEAGTLRGSTMPFYQEIEYHAGPRVAPPLQRARAHLHRRSVRDGRAARGGHAAAASSPRAATSTTGSASGTATTRPPWSRRCASGLRAMARRRGWF